MQPPSQKSRRSSQSDCSLVIMAKAPKPGMVKTRLAQDVPLEAVIQLYRCLLDDTIALAQSLPNVETAIMCPASDVDDLARFTENAVRVVGQNGQGLAAGLTSVFAYFADEGRRVVAFNSDSPHLPASALKSAFETLTRCDVVVGPTHDGGYYLVGAKASHPRLFDGDGMGTSSALELLLERVRTLGLSVHLADPCYDVDVISDLIRLQAELQFSPPKAPRTAAWLAQWRPLVGQLNPGAGNL